MFFLLNEHGAAPNHKYCRTLPILILISLISDKHKKHIAVYIESRSSLFLNLFDPSEPENLLGCLEWPEVVSSQIGTGWLGCVGCCRESRKAVRRVLSVGRSGIRRSYSLLARLPGMTVGVSSQQIVEALISVLRLLLYTYM